MTEPERPSLTMPAELTRRALALATGEGDWQVPRARDAATVLLLRETATGFEVFLQRRVSRMAFAPGMYVFPGGRAESGDLHVPWRGPDGEPFPIAVGAAETATYRALTVAGARETWEEAGVVLATGPAGPAVDRPADPAADLAEWVVARGYEIDGASFAPWCHWITPEVETRRFDTRFLVAALPPGQEATDRGVESDHSSWLTPGRALDGLRAGDMPMLPPTADALTQLAAFGSVTAVVAEATQRAPRPWLPRPLLTSAGELEWRIVDAYSGDPIEVP